MFKHLTTNASERNGLIKLRGLCMNLSLRLAQQMRFSSVGSSPDVEMH